MKRILLLLALAAACSRGTSTGPAGEPAAPIATPVRVGAVTQATLRRTVSAPGRTLAMTVVQVSAPFDAIVVKMPLRGGEQVQAGETIGELLSQNSSAALEGARAMADAARTPQERVDARRALRLARESQVRHTLVAPLDGLASPPTVTEGDAVAAHDPIVSIAGSGSTAFVADVPQSELPAIRPGEPALIRLQAGAEPIEGRVGAILPATTDQVVPVRIELSARAPGAPGLFGYADIVVAEVQAIAVPREAVLRDDLTGATHIATAQGGIAHWVEVQVGLEDGSLVQIVSPRLALGTSVIVTGQVGLPEGARVTIEP